MKKYFFLLTIGIVLVSSCRKEEYQRPEVGSEIPFEDSVTHPLDALVVDVGNSLFRQLWTRSAVADKLFGTESSAEFTLLMPSESALISNGWTADKIASASEEEVFAVLTAHLFRGKISPQELAEKAYNYIGESLYVFPDVKYTMHGVPFHAKIALSWANGLLVNGRSAGTTVPMPARNGYVYFIDTVLTPPTSTAWEILEADERFSIYTTLMRQTDAAYAEIFKEANGYYPSEGHPGEQIYARDSPKNLGLSTQSSEAGWTYVQELNTFFIPTDAAFHAAGFHTVDDLMAYNRSRQLPTVTWQEPINTAQPGFYRVVGSFATDSLLDYHHHWGLGFADPQFNRIGHQALLFSNDVQAPFYRDFPVASYTKQIYSGNGFLIRAETVFYPMPFLFTGDQVIRIAGTDQQAKIVVPNKYSLTGVVHGVDQLLMPEKPYEQPN